MPNEMREFAFQKAEYIWSKIFKNIFKNDLNRIE